MNIVWLLMVVVGVLAAATCGRMEVISSAIVSGSEQAVSLAIALLAILSFWLGIARVAEKAGLLEILARMLAPLLRPLFPSLKENDPALRHIVLNFTANLLGLGNAATPFGLRAMQAMQAKSRHKDEATDAMCTLLTLNTAGLTLVPTTVIALRAASGSSNPTATVGVTLLSGLVGITVGLVVDRLLRPFSRR